MGGIDVPDKVPDLQLHVGMPDHALGYRASTLKRRLGEQHFNRLWSWMYGQTMALSDDAEPILYEHDVRRWLSGEQIID